MADKEEDSLEVGSSDKHVPENNKLSRRRFAKTGAAGAAVVMSLLNRSAFGHGNHKQCTYSILASYNLSENPDLNHCKFACSPGYWKPNNLQHICSWDNEISSDYARDVIFSTAFKLPSSLRDPNDPFSEALYTLTLEQVVLGELPPSCKQYGYHAVAALMNSVHPLVNTAYPFSLVEVLMNFFDAYSPYINSNTDPGSRDKSMLETFKNKYDIYDEDHVACPLPTDRCSGGNPKRVNGIRL